MRWMVGLLLLALLCRVQAGLAQEEGSETLNEDRVEEIAYDHAIARFNSNIKKFSSWDAFQAEIVSKISPDTLGICYELTGDTTKPVEVTRVGFPRMESDGWKQTRGKGWRRTKKDRTFIEYRVNKKAGVLLWIKGVKPRFFFAHTRQICEFPL
ncbi:hypothetical protein NKDENANG_03831 [Candidatus Entotheonellaceae bacterium PAL068K]